jgi:hypothetical protein
MNRKTGAVSVQRMSGTSRWYRLVAFELWWAHRSHCALDAGEQMRLWFEALQLPPGEPAKVPAVKRFLGYKRIRCPGRL